MESSAGNRVIVHYFTGTGNTARIVQLLAAGLAQNGYSVKTLPLDKSQNAAAEVGDFASGLTIFAFPVHGFAIPKVMRDFIGHFPKVAAGSKCVVIALVGEINAKQTLPGFEGQALNEARRLLNRRGFEVQISDAVGHVNNFTQFVSPPSDAEDAGIDQNAQEKVRQIVTDIVAEKAYRKRCSLGTKLWSAPVGWLFRNIGRPHLAKLFIADKNCNSCSRCAISCPVGAIKMIHHRPRWNFSCQACQRCINLCPQNAIQTSLARLIISVAALLVPYWRFARMLLPADVLSPLGWAGGVVFNILCWVIGSLTLLYLLDKILFALESIPPLQNLMAILFTRKFRRYIQPDFKKSL